MDRTEHLNITKSIIESNSPTAILGKSIRSIRPNKFIKRKSLRPSSTLFYETNEKIEAKQKKIFTLSLQK